MSKQRYSDDLLNSLVCSNSQAEQFTIAGVHIYANGNCDTGLLSLTNDATGEVTLFFKGNLSVCIIGEGEDCDQINDGRGANVDVPYLRLAGQLFNCNNPVPQWKSMSLFAASGQTLAQLQEQLIQLLERNC